MKYLASIENLLSIVGVPLHIISPQFFCRIIVIPVLLPLLTFKNVSINIFVYNYDIYVYPLRVYLKDPDPLY